MNTQELVRNMAGNPCSLRSDCRKESDRMFFNDLFESDWEVFVVRRDSENGRFKWTTACCVAATRETK